jgi:hypothetical protein
MPEGFQLDWETTQDLAASIAYYILHLIDLPPDPFAMADETTVLLTGALVTQLAATSGAQFEAASFSHVQDRLGSLGIEIEKREGAAQAKGGEKEVHSYVFRSEGKQLEIRVLVPGLARATGVA